MNTGDVVTIKQCSVCPKVVGKTAKVTKTVDIEGQEGVEVSFGRGRPQKGRPSTFILSDVELCTQG